jgi:hypothetical protein
VVTRPPGPVEQQIGRLIQALLCRGIDDGTFRGDLAIDELGFVLGQLLQAGPRMAAGHQAGVKKAAALVTSVFLHGTQNREDAPQGDRATRRHSEAEPEEHIPEAPLQGGEEPPQGSRPRRSQIAHSHK